MGRSGGTISISRKEERQNSGEGRIIGLLDAKVKQAELSMREYLNKCLVSGEVSSATFVPYQSDGGVNGLNPLGYFLRKDPTTDPVRGGNVGNISGSTYTWWRPRFGDLNNTTPSSGDFGISSCTTYAKYKVALRRMYNYCSRGSGGAPDLCVTDQTSFETYENALDANIRYQNTKMADMGFDTIKLRGATCIWDEVMPDIETGVAYDSDSYAAGTWFYLNTNFYKLMIDSETDLITTPFVTPQDQTARTAAILFMGQAGVSNLRKHGVLWGGSLTITS